MILPDVNVLIYAFRPDMPQHTDCSRWLQSVVNGEAAYGMSPQVLSSVARILTNRRIYVQPDPLEKVLAFADMLLNQPHCQIIESGPRHWRIFCDLCQKTNARGDLVPDAWFAALAIESGCEWITLDRDFRRFDGLRWRAPF
ncbi:MAG: type II toxin-antitoxin system VapC family toxin [Acidobacteriia bacterium]|nr:type II toxin-antitoxin system VapC family toxin [Terriglobia bacterium]